MQFQNISRIVNETEKAKSDYRKAIEQIQSDDSLSLFGKQQKGDQLYNDLEETLKEKRQTFDQTIEQTRQELTSKAFRVGKDVSALEFDDMAFRMADSKITPKERQKRISSGSSVTARAVARGAYIAGDLHTVQAYLDQFPGDDSGHITKLVDLERSYGSQMNASQKFARGAIFSKPSRPNFQ